MSKRQNCKGKTIAWAQRQGWMAGDVEIYNYFAKRSFDLFGFIDVAVIDGRRGTAFYQATSKNNHADRRRKITVDHAEAAWKIIDAGNRIYVISWAKRDPEPKIERIYKKMLKCR